MNKALFLVLVICLVSAHAFVKRDAPEAPKNEFSIENIQKKITEGLQNLGDMAVKIDIKKGVEDALANLSKTLEQLKPKETPKQ